MRSKTLNPCFIGALMASCLLGGCIEGSPAYWSAEPIAYTAIPEPTRDSFEEDFPDERPLYTEVATFPSRLSGYPKLYHFAIRDGSSAIYDERGHPTRHLHAFGIFEE